MSASSSTTRALLPLSSRMVRLKNPAAVAAMWRPTRSEPLNEITRGTGCSMNASPISALSVIRTLSSPAGSPASSKIFAISPPPTTGALWWGFTTTALPSASAGATDFMVTRKGKLKALITPTTPTGSRYRRFSRPSETAGSRRPVGRSDCRIASRSTSVAPRTSYVARSRVPPSSSMIASTISSVRSPVMRRARSRTARRSYGLVAAHSCCARSAAR
ncbi:hypothetical protein SMICM17S_01417 [Streptomyces microflavus]